MSDDIGTTLEVSLDDIALLGAMVLLTSDQEKAEKRTEAETRNSFVNLGGEYDRSAYLGAPHSGTDKAPLTLNRMSEINNVVDFFADRGISENAVLASHDKAAGQIASRINIAFKQGEAGDTASAINTFKEVLRLRSLHLNDPEFNTSKAAAAQNFIRDSVVHGADGKAESALQATYEVYAASKDPNMKERDFQKILDEVQEIRQVVVGGADRKEYPATPRSQVDTKGVFYTASARKLVDPNEPPVLTPELAAKADAVDAAQLAYTRQQMKNSKGVTPPMAVDAGRTTYNKYEKPKDLFARDVPKELLGDSNTWTLD